MLSGSLPRRPDSDNSRFLIGWLTTSPLCFPLFSLHFILTPSPPSLFFTVSFCPSIPLFSHRRPSISPISSLSLTSHRPSSPHLNPSRSLVIIILSLSLPSLLFLYFYFNFFSPLILFLPPSLHLSISLPLGWSRSKNKSLSDADWLEALRTPVVGDRERERKESDRETEERREKKERSDKDGGLQRFCWCWGTDGGDGRGQDIKHAELSHRLIFM